MVRLVNHIVKRSAPDAEIHFNKMPKATSTTSLVGNVLDQCIASVKDNSRRLRKQANLIRGGFLQTNYDYTQTCFLFSNSKRPVLLIDVRIICFEQVVKAKTKNKE